MKIAVDAMGGDHAPADVVMGAVEAARTCQVGIALVGPQAKIKEELEQYDTRGLDIDIVHTDEYLTEGEQPAYALRLKRNASINLAVKLVRQGQASAVYSAGPTGGVIASALGILGMLEGISRPVIGGPFVGFAPRSVIMDVGGSVDIRPDQLLDFAVVGAVYARTLLDIANPSVAILSIGAEEGKGNELVKDAFPLFKNSGLNFVGSVEGYDIVKGTANVIVCDGFVGNVLVKFYESLGRAMAKWLSVRLAGKLSEAETQSLCADLVKLTNAADTFGGGPIWAVNGIVVKGHGRSHHDEVARGIAQAKQLAENDVAGVLKRELTVIRNRLPTLNLEPKT